jgi:uncharacterized protein DUF4349
MRLRLALGIALLALAGCSSDGGGDAASAPEPMTAEQRDAAAPAGEEADGDTGGIAGGALVDRSIIYTGSITVQVENVDEAAASATAVAQRYQGFVGGDRRTASSDGDSDDDQAQATLILRIPSESFTSAIADLAGLGEERSRELQTQDVTEEVVDLETRIASAESSVERTRDLMEQAQSIDDIVRVEAELSERETALGSLQARQRELADLTSLSTITVTLLAPAAEPVRRDDEADDGFLAGLGAGWRALASTVTVLLTVLGALLPWLLAFGVPVAAGWWLFRRRRPGPASPEQPPGTP